MAMWATAGFLVLLCLPCGYAARIAAVNTRSNVNASGGSEAQAAVETYAASDRKQTSASTDCLSTRSSDYRRAVCAGLKTGKLKGDELVDADKMVALVARKGCTCTVDELNQICGLAVKVVKMSPEDECRHKLDERQTGLSGYVCAALKAGKLKNGSRVDANSVVDVIAGEKGVRCAASAYEKMCGLPGAFFKKVNTCRSRLNHHQQGLAKAVCAALKDGTTKDGESVNSHSMVDLVYGDKGIRCTSDEYERMCSGMKCQALLIAKADEGFPHETCDILGHEYEGSVVDEARLAGAVFEEKGVRCEAADFTEMCSSI